MAYSDDILALGPIAYFKLDETSGTALADASGNIADGSYINAPTLGQPPAVGAGTAVEFDGTTQYGQSGTDSALSGATQCTLIGWLKLTQPLGNSGDGRGAFLNWFVDSNNYLELVIDDTAGTFQFNLRNGGLWKRVNTQAGYATEADYIMVAAVFNAGTVDLYIDGAAVAVTYVLNQAVSALPTGSGPWYVAYRAINLSYWGGLLDDFAVFDKLLTAQQISDLKDAAVPPVPVAAVLPMTLSGQVGVAAASLPLRLLGASAVGSATLPMTLEAPDPSHYQAAAAHWSAQVVLGGVDISARLVGRITIEHEETASTLARLSMVPTSGAIDPGAYERQPIAISYLGHDSAGATLYSSRRFTGLTSEATFNPDSGELAIEATTDLQGQLENMPRAAIDALIGGYWSEHVFDGSADGWRYAQDRLSTIPAELHCNRYGQPVLVDWAAKASADVEISDAERFGDVALTRANRRDLLTRVIVNLDFRFVRLRHREIFVNFVDTLGFCHWLNNGWSLPSKDMVRAAADATEWTRISDILYTELPVPGTYCTPPRGWVGGADAFCLGATWKAARRWAQTVTEQYALEVVASDLETSIGRQTTNDDYGIAATYDATDYEAIRSFDSAPTGAVLSGKTDDWQLEATAAESDGRAAMAVAQTCALARARSLILGRARASRLRVPVLFDPTLSLASTLRIASSYVTAKGKVAKLDEVLDLTSGDTEMTVELALSRHEGSGLAVDDPIDPADPPEQPDETPSARSYYLSYHIGGTSAAPPDNDEWDGHMSNVAAALQDPGAELYSERFVVRMPEIEAGARNASTLAQTASYALAVPQDELTLSN